MVRVSFDLAQASAAVKAGGVRSAVVRAAKGAFFVELETRESGVVALVTKNGRTPRAFRDPGQALKIVRELGVAHGRFALDEWDTHAPKGKAWRRPDSAAHLKATHQRAQEADEYDAWFRAEVEQGLREADDPAIEKIPHDQAMAMLTQMRDAARAKSGRTDATPARRPTAAKVATTRQRTAVGASLPRKPATAAKSTAKRKPAA